MQQALLLGQVVTQLQLTSEEDVSRAMRFAKETGSSLGQALVAQEIISPTVLKACIQAQWMLRDQVLTIEECRAAVALVQRRKWTFADALLTLGFSTDDTRGIRLGELLRESGLLAPELIDRALERATSSCLPLGRAIVSFDFLEQDTVDRVLKIQGQIRQGELTVAEGLHLVAKLKVSSQALSKTSRILTRLLIDANFVTVEDVQSYHTAAVTTGRSLSDLLSLYSTMDSRQLFVLSSIARRIEAGTLTYKDGMHLAKQFNISYADESKLSAVDYKDGKVSFYVYLRLIDYLNATKTQALIEYLSANQNFVEELLQKHTTGYETGSPSANVSWKVKVRMCIESDDMLDDCLTKAFHQDAELVRKAHYMLHLVNANCLKLEESLVWNCSADELAKKHVKE